MFETVKKWYNTEKQLKEERRQIKSYAKNCIKSTEPQHKGIGFTGLFIKGQWDYEKQLALSPSGTEYPKMKNRKVKLSCGKL